MEINEGASSANNAYMKPIGRSSLLSRPAPILKETVQEPKVNEEEESGLPAGTVKYTPNEPEEEPAAPAEEAPAKENNISALFWERPMQQSDEEEEEKEPEIAPDQPWEQPYAFPAYEEPVKVQQEASEPAPQMEDVPQNGEEISREEAAYMEYWQQWHTAMAAQQNIATCSVCPLLHQTGSRKGRVCLVPVIIPDAQEDMPEPEAVLTMISRSKPEEQELVAPETPAETPAEEPEAFSDILKQDEEDFAGEDIMPDDQMPQPQTVPQEVPNIGVKKQKKLGWLWFLLALILLVGGFYAAGRMGWLTNFLLSLHLPEKAEEILMKLGMM